MKHLLQHFKTLTKHPQNAGELKGLILQLAIQGKLTENWRKENPNVQTASELLENVKIEKQRLIEEKEIRKIKTPSIDESKIPFHVPTKWKWTRMIDYLDVRDGTHDSPKYQDSGIPLVTSKNLYTKKLDISNVKFISQKDHEEISRRSKVDRDDILFAMIGSIGNPVIVDIEPNFSIKNVALIKYYNKDLVEPNFILNFLEFATKEFKAKSDGAVQSFVSLKKLRMKLIPVPPLEEQKAIVAIVNELFAEVEQLEEQTKNRIRLKEDFVTSALKRLSQADNINQEWQFLQTHFTEFFTEKENVKQLRETILQLAVQGKLTANWRSCHPELVEGSHHANELLKRIQTEKQELIAQKKLKKEKPYPKVEKEEEPFDLPNEWVWCRFQEIFDIRDGTHDSPKDSNDKITYPLVTSKNFKDGKIDFESARRISEEDYLKVIQRSQVHKGDILFSMIGGNIGNQVEVDNFTEYAIKNVALFKHYKYGLPAEGFLKVFSQYIAMSLQNEAAGGAQPFVSLKLFRNIIFGLPPLEEQKAIVKQVNSLMALCDSLEEQIEHSQTQIVQLMQSCLREVFKKNN